MDAVEATEYLCPGKYGPVSRAVHLARLAAGDPICRNCPHHGDQAGLSPRWQAKIAQRGHHPAGELYCDEEHIAGLASHAVESAAVRQLAVALAIQLRHRNPEVAAMPLVVVAGDGRAVTAEALAAVSDGIRWAGCHVVEAGSIASPCLVHAMVRLQADGGIYVGQPPRDARDLGMKFWIDRKPVSAGGPLERLLQVAARTLDRPTRRFGLRRRCEADRPYHAELADRYHGLRPLRFVVETRCAPSLRDIRTLIQPTACELVTAGPFHFRMAIADDGESCQVADERGRPVPPERLLVLLARHVLSRDGVGYPEAGQKSGPVGSPLPPGTATIPKTIVLEEETSPGVVRSLRSLGATIVHANRRRNAMAEAMGRSAALLGGGPCGRVWYPLPCEGWCDPGEPCAVADALATLTLLLEVLSRSDRPLSGVLDAESPIR